MHINSAVAEAMAAVKAMRDDLFQAKHVGTHKVNELLAHIRADKQHQLEVISGLQNRLEEMAQTVDKERAHSARQTELLAEEVTRRRITQMQLNQSRDECKKADEELKKLRSSLLQSSSVADWSNNESVQCELQRLQQENESLKEQLLAESVLDTKELMARLRLDATLSAQLAEQHRACLEKEAAKRFVLEARIRELERTIRTALDNVKVVRHEWGAEAVRLINESRETSESTFNLIAVSKKTILSVATAAVQLLHPSQPDLPLPMQQRPFCVKMAQLLVESLPHDRDEKNIDNYKERDADYLKLYNFGKSFLKNDAATLKNLCTDTIVDWDDLEKEGNTLANTLSYRQKAQQQDIIAPEGAHLRNSNERKTTLTWVGEDEVRTALQSQRRRLRNQSVPGEVFRSNDVLADHITALKLNQTDQDQQNNDVQVKLHDSNDDHGQNSDNVAENTNMCSRPDDVLSDSVALQPNFPNRLTLSDEVRWEVAQIDDQSNLETFQNKLFHTIPCMHELPFQSCTSQTYDSAMGGNASAYSESARTIIDINTTNPYARSVGDREKGITVVVPIRPATSVGSHTLNSSTVSRGSRLKSQNSIIKGDEDSHMKSYDVFSDAG